MDAVVFDLDGVLIDSEPVWERVRRAFVAEWGGHWAPEAQSRMMGMSTVEWSRYLSLDLGVGLPAAQVAETVIERMEQAYADDLPLMPSALDVIQILLAQWPLGLASSSPRRLIAAVLLAGGLDEAFAVTVSAEEVGRGKPAPDVYLAAAERLSVRPRSCVAVEDSTNGVRAAVAAGMRCVAVPQSRYPVEPDVLRLAATSLRSLDELTPARVSSLD